MAPKCIFLPPTSWLEVVITRSIESWNTSFLLGWPTFRDYVNLGSVHLPTKGRQVNG